MMRIDEMIFLGCSLGGILIFLILFLWCCTKYLINKSNNQKYKYLDDNV